MLHHDFNRLTHSLTFCETKDFNFTYLNNYGKRLSIKGIFLLPKYVNMHTCQVRQLF